MDESGKPAKRDGNGEPSIRHVRDALIHLELVTDRPNPVELRGILTEVRKRRGVVFYDFEDATASVQLLAQREQFSDEEWADLRGWKRSARVIASGTMTRSNRGTPTVLLDRALTSIDGVEPGAERTVRGLDRIGVRIFLARLRFHAEEYFKKTGFLQIEPRFILELTRFRGRSVIGDLTPPPRRRRAVRS